MEEIEVNEQALLKRKNLFNAPRMQTVGENSS